MPQVRNKPALLTNAVLRYTAGVGKDDPSLSQQPNELVDESEFTPSLFIEPVFLSYPVLPAQDELGPPVSIMK